MYRQIMDQVRYLVTARVLKPGDRLPSIRSLARDLAVNPSTIVKAYTELEHGGTVVNRQGMGAFVTESTQRLSAKEQEKAIAELARELWVTAGQLGTDANTVARIVEAERRKIENERES